MATPRQILGRSGKRPTAVQTQVEQSERTQNTSERIVVPQPIRQNSVYRRLMESHDRMHTRHVR